MFIVDNLNNISQWETNNLRNVSGIFRGYLSLKSLPDISIWMTHKLTNFSQVVL